MDWHTSQSLTTAWTASFKTSGLICFTKYNAHFMPGCPLHWWIVCIWVDPPPVLWTHCTLAPFLFKVHLAIIEAPLWIDQLSSCEIWQTTPQLLAYIPQPVPCRHLIDISVTAFVYTLVFPDSISKTVMYMCWLCLQVNHGYLPLHCQVDASQHWVKLHQVNVLVFVYQVQPTCIHSLIAMCWILLCYSSDDVHQHLNQKWIPNFIILARCYKVCLLFHKCGCDLEPTAQWQMSG